MLMKNLSVMSPTFENNKLIPAKYTCDGDDVNPPLTIEGVPEGTKTLALIVDDPDAPMGTWDHWIVWNIPATTSKIAENTVPGTEGMNDFRKRSYGGPCPPSGTHRYFFKVYALDVRLNLSPTSRKRDVEKAMQGHVLAKGELVGLYRRSR
jgi:Raf kinase inhibitor-like YbhB/YbcL family protein